MYRRHAALSFIVIVLWLLQNISKSSGDHSLCPTVPLYTDGPETLRFIVVVLELHTLKWTELLPDQ